MAFGHHRNEVVCDNRSVVRTLTLSSASDALLILESRPRAVHFEGVDSYSHTGEFFDETIGNTPGILRHEIEVQRLSYPSVQLTRVMALHRCDAKRLGFFPKGAFEEHAKHRQIIVALDETHECIGYLLFRVARGRAAIVHLCVAAPARGKSVARCLVEELKLETRALEGIGLYCRRDYEINHIWSKLGFEAVSSKAGRGQDGAELTFWWFSHGHQDLFSQASEPDPVRQRVVVDANVFFDLHFRDTPESEDSKAMLADWVQASVELVITKELLNEIAQAPDEHVRNGSRAATTQYVKLKTDDTVFQRLCLELRSLFPSVMTSRDEADRRQVANAIAGGAPFLVTRDQVLVDRCEALYRSHGLTVLHPAELINHLDSVEREADYRPARIEGSRLKNCLLKADELDAVIDEFKAPDERVGDFRKQLLHWLGRPRTSEVQVISDQMDAWVLLGVMERERDHVMSVPMFRRTRHAIAATMMRNFLRATIAAAASEGRNMVVVSDPKLSELETDMLREFGFHPCGETWAKITLRAAGSLDEIRRGVVSLCLDASLENAKAAALAAVSAAAEIRDPAAISAIERQLWPAKVVTAEMPTFIVSIRPDWAQHFFDSELGSQFLFGLREDLHLGVEGVYYRKAGNNNLSAPGRILWYVSQGDGRGSMTIKACSHLEEMVVGKAKDLFRRFQRLGVYEWRNVFETADKDLAKDIVAVRFRMTERFRNPVDMEFLQGLGIRGPFMSPRQISESQFGSIYTKGCFVT